MQEKAKGFNGFQEFKWRVSNSGFSILSGSDENEYLIAKYPGAIQPLDSEEFQNWLNNAELICELFNNTLK